MHKKSLMKKNLIKQKSGFTIAELVVVMFLLGLVAIIATSITLMANRSQQNHEIDNKSQTELVNLESAFKDWLMSYDTAEFKFIIDESSIGASKYDRDAIYDIKFENGTLSYFPTADGETQTIKFSSIKDVTFSNNGDIICCTAYLENNYKHKILYTLRAATIWNQNLASAGDNNE